VDGKAPDAELVGFLDSLRAAGRPTADAERLVRSDPVTGALAAIGLDAASMAAERAEAFRRCVALCPAVALDVAGHREHAGLGPAELWRFYLPICQAVRALRPGGARALVGIAGPGASGKSVFAGLLSLLLLRAWPEGGGAALCPMDGFHRSNADLDAHALRARKGAPETFDAEAFVRCLRRLKAGRTHTVPRYDRRLHDPVPDGARIGTADRLVLVEGNYLLLGEGAWAEVQALLDLRLFLTTPAETMREAMIERHVRGGRSPAAAAAHFARVDEPNSRLILGGLPRADLVVERDAQHRVVGIRRPPPAGQAADRLTGSVCPL